MKTFIGAHKLLAVVALGLSTVLTGALITGVMIKNSSEAAFSATSGPNASTWGGGSVILNNDSTGTALFTVPAAKPGDTGTKCITVTYSGTLAANVKEYVSASSGTLGQYIDLTIERGTGGSSASCTGFVAEATDYAPGTLGAFQTARTNFSNGVGTWAPAGGTSSKTYRITYTIQNNNAAQGLSASATFMWEAQNV